MKNIWVSIKRFVRVLIAGAIAGIITALLKEYNSWPLFFIIQPAVTAIIAAIAKYIRTKWGIELPV